MILFGDCKEKLKELDDDSIDAAVTDPPYELGFMGKKWDEYTLFRLAYEMAGEKKFVI